jgi:hypothetical protein
MFPMHGKMSCPFDLQIGEESNCCTAPRSKAPPRVLGPGFADIPKQRKGKEKAD